LRVASKSIGDVNRCFNLSTESRSSEKLIRILETGFGPYHIDAGKGRQIGLGPRITTQLFAVPVTIKFAKTYCVLRMAGRNHKKLDINTTSGRA